MLARMGLNAESFFELSNYCKIYSNGHDYFMIIDSPDLIDDMLTSKVQDQALLRHALVKINLAMFEGTSLYFCSNNGKDFHQMECTEATNKARWGKDIRIISIRSHESASENKPCQMYVDVGSSGSALLLKRYSEARDFEQPHQNEVLASYALVPERQKVAMFEDFLTEKRRLVPLTYRVNNPAYLFKIPGSAEYISVMSKSNHIRDYTVNIGSKDAWKEIPIELSECYYIRGEACIKFKKESNFQEIHSPSPIEFEAKPYLQMKDGRKVELEALDVTTFDYASIGITLEPYHTRITSKSLHEKSQRSALASAFHARVGARSPLNQALLKNPTMPEPKILFKFFSLAGIPLPAKQSVKRKRPRSPSV